MVGGMDHYLTTAMWYYLLPGIPLFTISLQVCGNTYYHYYLYSLSHYSYVVWVDLWVDLWYLLGGPLGTLDLGVTPS